MDRAVAYWAASAMFVVGHFLTDLMDQTGSKGAYVNGLAFAPVLAYAAWRGDLRGLFRWGTAALMILLMWTAVTGLWSVHGIDAAVSAYAFAVAISFAALFRGRPEFLRASANAATVFALVWPLVVIITNRPMLDLGFCLPMLGMLGDAAVSGRLGWRTTVLLPLVALSTFRAALLGCSIAAVLLLIRGLAGRVILVTACLAAAIYLGPGFERHTAAEPDRTDILGRWQNVRDDGASHRMELWPAIIDDLEAHAYESPTLFGRTIGDAAYHVAGVFPLIAQPGHGGWVASTHNTVLEFVVMDGLVALPLIALALVLLAFSVRLSEPSGAIAVAVGVVSLANVAICDLAGGAAVFGLMMAVALRA